MTPFYRGGDQDTEKLTDLLKVMQSSEWHRSSAVAQGSRAGCRAYTTADHTASPALGDGICFKLLNVCF